MEVAIAQLATVIKEELLFKLQELLATLHTGQRCYHDSVTWPLCSAFLDYDGRPCL
ncbi:hypothetical protein JKP88DRAFT_351935 [Tribonema minus]|uniref:Uncharacterized protein n=1 Tax=Tribonema minus TaxID=303371 RepID=A0A835ZFW8_9STRA|nr:hypothetical protein JKP88DRAFT_351935 [Tribonema minus]